jgi:predicted transposase YbfD/YdcC
MVSIIEAFSSVKDFRMERRKRHDLIDILVIAICAVISGAEGFNEIADWGKAKKAWLSKFLQLRNDIPSHDTFRRVFAMLDPKVFQETFMHWIGSINLLLDNKLVAIDGKTLRRSYDPINNKRALHLVSAWASDAQISLGQIQVDEKSNEITAIPELLEMLELSGAIITIDAMGCQKEIASKIASKSANYVLALKKNHGNLYEDIETFFKLEDEATQTIVSSIDKDHGRVERRVVSISNTIDWLPDRALWKNLKSVICVSSIRTTIFGEHRSNRYYLSSLSSNSSEKIAHAIRAHWSIENQLHWCLDVVFHEDQSRIRNAFAIQNISLIRKMAISLLKNSSSHRDKSLKRKRFLLGIDDSFLLELLNITLN